MQFHSVLCVNLARIPAFADVTNSDGSYLVLRTDSNPTKGPRYPPSLAAAYCGVHRSPGVAMRRGAVGPSHCRFGWTAAMTPMPAMIFALAVFGFGLCIRRITHLEAQCRSTPTHERLGLNARLAAWILNPLTNMVQKTKHAQPQI
jgi:hypothetical protein